MIAALPLGNSLRVEISKSPKTVIATVLGIGVAVITRRWGGCFAFIRSASRCSTPNLCCSSTTTRPRSSNSTPSEIRACVPITIPVWPEANFACITFFSAVESEPVKSSTAVPISLPSNVPAIAKSPSNLVMVR